jgi:hypothetical protein
VLEPIIRTLNCDDDCIVRRAAANAILISLRPYNIDNSKTISTIAGANLSLVGTPLSTSQDTHHVVFLTVISELASPFFGSK